MLFDQILAAYVTALTGGFAILHALSLPLLGIIAGVSWVRGSMQAIGQAFGDVLANAVLMLITLVVYYLILVNLHPWMTGAFQLAADLGARVGGLSGASFMSPSSVFLAGQTTAAPIVQYLKNQTGWAALLNIPTIVNFSFAHLLIILAFLGVTLNICLTIISFHFALLCSTVLIPWAPLVGTAFLAEMAFGWLSATVVRMLVQVIIVGVSIPLFEALVLMTSAGGDPLWFESLGLAGGAVFFFVVSWIIPNEATRMLVGRGQSLGLGGDAFLRGATAGARGVAGTVSAGAAVLSGVTSWIRHARTP